MDAARVTRLLAEGRLTQDQVDKAAALGLVSSALSTGNVATQVANAATMRAALMAVLNNGPTINAQFDAAIAGSTAIANNPATDLSTAQILAMLKTVASTQAALAAAAKQSRAAVADVVRLMLVELDAVG